MIRDCCVCGKISGPLVTLNHKWDQKHLFFCSFVLVGALSLTPRVGVANFGQRKMLWGKHSKQTWNLSKNLHDLIFVRKNFTHWKRVNLDFFASEKQWKCIIISNLGLFWLKLDKMCNFFNSCEESLHWGVWKFAKYVRNCVVFWKNLQSG